jgi:hypothetical protein
VLLFYFLSHSSSLYLSFLYSSLMKVSYLNPREYELANLEHQYRSALRNRRVCPLYLVEAVLNASRVKIPACRDGNILLAIDRK